MFSEPPWMPRTEEEYRQQLAEDAGPQPDEMVRLQQALGAAEVEIDRLNRLVDTLSRALVRYQDEEIKPERCSCGRPLLFPGDADPWCEGCTMSASTCDCVVA